MGRKTAKKTDSNLIVENRKARFEYHIEERFEAGLLLEGWEVKSLRAGRVQLIDSYVLLKNGEAWLLGAHITPLPTASTHITPDPSRSRKLLLHRKELDKLTGAVERKGFTAVALRLYWKKAYAKLEIALAKGKKLHDKRATLRERAISREQQGALHSRNL